MGQAYSLAASTLLSHPPSGLLFSSWPQTLFCSLASTKGILERVLLVAQLMVWWLEYLLRCRFKSPLEERGLKSESPAHLEKYFSY